MCLTGDDALDMLSPSPVEFGLLGLPAMTSLWHSRRQGALATHVHIDDGQLEGGTWFNWKLSML